MTIKVGEKAPSFSLQNQNGEKVALKDFLGKKVILYFYPKDMTPGCTTEACEFNAKLPSLHKKKTVVLGISKDSIERHLKFAEKYELEFSLLSDEEGVVCEKYGVWREKNLYGKKSMGIVRSTFIIDEKGLIKKIYDKVKVAGHVDSVLEVLTA